MKITQKLAGKLAHSPILRQGKHLFEKNSKDWNALSSKADKLQAGVFLILEDYSRGLFPPKFEDQAAAYAAEMNYRYNVPGLDPATINLVERQKPFYAGRSMERYLGPFIRFTKLLDQVKASPPSRLLELGCGTGWMSEFMAIAGFDVTGTSISPPDIADARRRIESLAVKGISAKLRFEASPMEEVAEKVGPRNYYEVVYVFEALHHAFDWRQAIQSSFECLRPGGWLLICQEPNLLHTFASYRVAKLSNTHEIGFSRGALTKHLAKTGFHPIKYASTPFHFWIKPHWIAAQKRMA